MHDAHYPIIYALAAWSNWGPASVYLTVMIATISGLELPRIARWGSRNFFFGCFSTHVLMFLMMLAMASMMGPDPALLVISALMVLVNVQQTVGGWAFVHDVATKRIRVIRFRPATEEAEGEADKADA